MNNLPPAYEAVIDETNQWIEKVVIKHQFCPFAAKPYFGQDIGYRIIIKPELGRFANHFLKALHTLDQSDKPETTLLIFPDSVNDFLDYLDLLADAEDLLVDHDYEGIYQLASFHPRYQFAGTTPDDVTNKTNRSPYPIVQILREKSITDALENFANPEQIPERNMTKAREIFGNKPGSDQCSD